MGRTSTIKRDFGTWDASVYQDTGCEIHPTCIDCPLPKCVFDVAEKLQGSGYVKFAKIYPILQRSQNPQELVTLLGCTRRTAFNHIKRYRESGGDFSTFVLG